MGTGNYWNAGSQFLVTDGDEFWVENPAVQMIDDKGETELPVVLVSDDFNRPDGAIGNGWTVMTGNEGGNLVIDDGALTAPEPVVNAGIYRPLSLDEPITVSCDITEGNGYGGLTDRFTMQLLVGSDGSIGTGYGIFVYRGDAAYANSSIVLMYNGVNIGADFSTFQFSETLHLEVTFNPDGSISGTVSQPGSSFDFDFPPFAFVASGSNFAIVSGGPDTRASPPVAPTLDNLVITTGSGANADPDAANDGYTAQRTSQLVVDEAHGVLANDTDPDPGDVLEVTAVNGVPANVGQPLQGAFGTLTLQADGSFVYAPGPRIGTQARVDSFTYTVSDGAGGVATATLNINIPAAPTPPASGDDYAANSGTTGFLDVPPPGEDAATIGGIVEKAGDADWFAVELVAGHTYVFRAIGAEGGGGDLANPFMRLRDASGAPLVSNNDAVNQTATGDGTLDSWITYTATQSGTYYVSAGANNNGTGSYTIAAMELPTASPSFGAPVADPGDWVVTRNFGVPSSPGGTAGHLGDDWGLVGASAQNQSVFAIGSGIVAVAQSGGPTWGNVVIVIHQLPDGGWIAVDYAHLGVLNVTVGQVVEAGDLLGQVGPTPQGSTGPHLHLEVRTSDNPNYLQFGKGYLANSDGWVDPSTYLDDPTGLTAQSLFQPTDYFL